MLNLRGIYHSPHGPSDTQTLSCQFSNLRFASRVIGNFGRPLETDAADVPDAEDSGYLVEVSQNPLLAGLLSTKRTFSNDVELQDALQNVSRTRILAHNFRTDKDVHATIHRSHRVGF